MPSPAISRLDAAKSSTLGPEAVPIGGTTASANVTTSADPNKNATALAAHQVALASAPISAVASTANAIEGAKQLAAYTAVDHHVLPHHKVHMSPRVYRSPPH